MIWGIGTDIIEISRIKKAIEQNERFLERVFTNAEIKYFNSRSNRYEVIAGNFAAKEAIVKALGTGLRNFEWKDIEVLRDVLGKPFALVYNNARALLGEDSLIHISISHCKEYAVANAVIESLSEQNKKYMVESLDAEMDY